VETKTENILNWKWLGAPNVHQVFIPRAH